MRISLEDGTIYYEKDIVIKRGMTSTEALEQLGKIYPKPKALCGYAWFPALPNAFEGCEMKVSISNSPVRYVEFVVPRIKGVPKSREKQFEHLKSVIGEGLFELLALHENRCDFSWGTVSLSWDGRDVEMSLGICYR